MQEFLKNLEHEYQHKFSKALSEYLVGHTFSKVLFGNFEHVFVESGFILGEKPVMGVYGKIICRVTGLGPQFSSDKICFVLPAAVHVLPHFRG